MTKFEYMRSLILFLFMLEFALPIKAQTQEEIIQNHLKAIGGESNWTKVKSVLIEYQIASDAGTMKVSRKIIRNKSYRNDFKFESRVPAYKDHEFYILYTPQGGWKYMPDTRDKVEGMDSSELEVAKIDLDYDDPFIAYREKGINIQMMDLMYEGEKEYFKFQIHYPSGRSFICLLDTKTYLIRRMTEVNTDADNNKIFDDYRPTPEGLIFPRSITGSFGEQLITLIKINPVFPESTFKVTPPVNFR